MPSVEFSAGNTIKFLHCGAEFFPALIKSIDAASAEIYLETYLFATDDAGLAVLDSLTRAAARGVTVNLITDWLGTGRAGCRLLAEALRHTTVNYRVFNQWFHRGVARTHRKICVVDKKRAFVGGININHDLHSAEGPETLPSPRWDFSVKVCGPIVDVIHKEAVGQWLRTGPLPLLDRLQLFAELRAPAVTPLPRLLDGAALTLAKVMPAASPRPWTICSVPETSAFSSRHHFESVGSSGAGMACTFALSTCTVSEFRLSRATRSCSSCWRRP